MPITRATAAALTAVFLACAPEGEERLESPLISGSLGSAFSDLRELASPAAARSITPYLSAGSDGSVLLSWQEPEGSGHAVRMARLSGSVWSEPRTIATGDDFFVNWADFPSLIELPDGSLAAHWLQREGPDTYAYGVRIARSSDDGQSWSSPLTPHLDGTLTEHGFVSLFPTPDGSLAAVWLDGRDFARAAAEADGAEALGIEAQHAETRAEGEPEPRDANMSLRYAEIDEAGEVRAEAVLDARTCDCCQTAAALTSAGPILVYRDRSGAEIRDISLVRRLDGRWTAPAVLHEDGWHIPACPVNGPAVSARGDRLAAAWYTAASDEPRVIVAFSEDAGASFGAALQVDAGQPLGRVDVALLPDGSALVLWLEIAEDGARVTARRIRADGATSRAETVALTDVSRSSGFPRMILRGTEVVLAWTDTAGEGSLRTAIATLPTE
jgi:hypothetical protein